MIASTLGTAAGRILSAAALAGILLLAADSAIRRLFAWRQRIRDVRRVQAIADELIGGKR